MYRIPEYHRLRVSLSIMEKTACSLFAVLLAVLCIPACVQAADYGWFSLNVPHQWRADKPENLAGVWTLSVSGPEAAVQVRIMVGKTAGPPDAADVAGLLRMAAGVREPVRHMDGQYVFRGKDSTGTDTACVVSADQQAGLYMAVLCSGAVDSAEPLLSALHSEGNPAMLPRRHAARGFLEPRMVPGPQ